MELVNRIDEAEQLAAQGRFADALDLLAAENRVAADAELELRLIDLRFRAAEAYDAGPGRTPWPPEYSDPFPEVVGKLPEIPATALTTDLLGGSVAHHGALIVRGVFSPEQIDRTVDAIDRAQAHRDLDDAADDRWYRPFEVNGRRVAPTLRQVVRDQGGTWLADSPRSTALVLDELRAAGTQVVVIEAAVLLEAGWQDLTDEVWVVTVPEPIAMQRLIARNGFSEDEARSRIRAQLSNEERARHADAVIDNSGSIEDARVQVRQTLAAPSTGAKRS